MPRFRPAARLAARSLRRPGTRALCAPIGPPPAAAGGFDSGPSDSVPAADRSPEAIGMGDNRGPIAPLAGTRVNHFRLLPVEANGSRGIAVRAPPDAPLAPRVYTPSGGG